MANSLATHISVSEKEKKKNTKLESLGLVPTWPDSVGYICCKPITNGKC